MIAERWIHDRTASHECSEGFRNTIVLRSDNGKNTLKENHCGAPIVMIHLIDDNASVVINFNGREQISTVSSSRF